MFITQNSSKVDNVAMDLAESDADDVLFLGLDKNDMCSPCVSLVNCQPTAVYSDISDAEDCNDIPNFK